jgi:hypothetical protein
MLAQICIAFVRFWKVWTVLTAVSTTITPVYQKACSHDPVPIFGHMIINSFFEFAVIFYVINHIQYLKLIL